MCAQAGVMVAFRSREHLQKRRAFLQRRSWRDSLPQAGETLVLPTQTHMLKFSGRKQRFLSKPAHSWTPTMPKMKKTKKQRRRTFPSMGKVSRSKFTRMRMPARGEENQKEQVWDTGIEKEKGREKEKEKKRKKDYKINI